MEFLPPDLASLSPGHVVIWGVIRWMGDYLLYLFLTVYHSFRSTNNVFKKNFVKILFFWIKIPWLIKDKESLSRNIHSPQRLANFLSFRTDEHLLHLLEGSCYLALVNHYQEEI